MIQRQQTLWLLLAAVCSFLSFQFPFYTGDKFENNITLRAELDAASNFFLIILTAALIIVSAVAIFLYKERKKQLRFTIGGLVLSIIILIFYFLEIKKFVVGSFSLTCLFVFVTLIAYVMAARGIWKDEKLVKSLDKLR
jgi:Na+/melibiose symporter-like transporter